MLRTEQTLCWLAIAAILLLTASGCAAWRDSGPMQLAKKVDIPNGVPWKREKTRRGVPRRIVATWTDTVKQQQGMEAERGFGGRIFFFDADETEPIGVEGRLVVYAFDETDRLPTDNRPTKKYVFPPEQFALHEGDSELGVSYSVWLPWDKVGGKQTDVSLITRFEPLKGGALLVSDQARERLEGRLDDHHNAAILASQNKTARGQMAGATSRSNAGVQQAGYSASFAPTGEPAAKVSGMQTTTIRAPGSRTGGVYSGVRKNATYGASIQ